MLSKENYEKGVKTYGYLASLPILVSIVHMLAQVFLQITLNYTEGVGFTNILSFPFTFGSSLLGGIIMEGSKNLDFVKNTSSLVGVVFCLALIFLSTAAVKGKKIYFYISSAIYGVDFLCMIASFITAFALSSTIGTHPLVIVMQSLLHLIFISLFVYGILLSKKLDEYEIHQTEIKNQIHTGD